MEAGIDEQLFEFGESFEVGGVQRVDLRLRLRGVAPGFSRAIIAALLLCRASSDLSLAVNIIGVQNSIASSVGRTRAA